MAASAELRIAQLAEQSGLAWFRPSRGFEWRVDLSVKPRGDLRQSMAPEPISDPPLSIELEEISGPWLVPVGERLATKLSGSEALLDAFLALGSAGSGVGSEAWDSGRLLDEVLHFANRNGWLGRPRIVFDEDWHQCEAEALSTWRSEIAAANNVFEWLHLGSALQRNQEVARRKTAGLITAGETGELLHLAGPAGGSGAILLGRGVPRTDAQMLSLLIEAATLTINQRLRGGIDATVGLSTRSLSYRPNKLVAAIYLQLARLLTGRRREARRCEYCHEPFLPTRSDQRYCSPTHKNLARYHRMREGSGAAK